MSKKIASTPKSTSHNNQAHRSRIPVKPELLLIEMLRAGTTGVSKLSMLSAYGETALPTTISELGLIQGLRIARELRPHTHRNGGTTRFTHYWLPNLDEATKAVVLINRFRAARDATPLDKSEIVDLLSSFPLFDSGEAAGWL